MENNYTYELVDDGYYILNNGKRIIEQRGNFADVVLPGKSYEENAKAHIAQLIETENNSNAQAEETKLLKEKINELHARADTTDAVILDILMSSLPM